MPLQNRVAPDGSLHAVASRGTMLGNRGGRFHRDDKTLGKRRWASHHWICCELTYKNMRHEPMGHGYTSLFFLDEVTALAAGHRPCFFCRRKEANAFLDGENVDSFDRRVHAERVHSPSARSLQSSFQKMRSKAQHLSGTPLSTQSEPGESGVPSLASLGWNDGIGDMANGTMFESNGAFFAKRGSHLLRWSFGGYTDGIPINPAMPMKLLTPPSIAAILQKGFKPRWHPSALEWDDMT